MLESNLRLLAISRLWMSVTVQLVLDNSTLQVPDTTFIQEGPWALDCSPESLLEGENVYHKI